MTLNLLKSQRRGKREGKKSSFVWKDEVVYHLINHSAAALDRIVDINEGNSLTSENMYPTPTKADVQEKMASLRVYNVQKNKVDSSKGTGTRTSSVYKT